MRRDYVETFLRTFDNAHTVRAYTRVLDSFMRFCDQKRLKVFNRVTPTHIADWVWELSFSKAASTVRAMIAVVRSFFDWLITGGIVRTNPAVAIRALPARVRQAIERRAAR